MLLTNKFLITVVTWFFRNASIYFCKNSIATLEGTSVPSGYVVRGVFTFALDRHKKETLIWHPLPTMAGISDCTTWQMPTTFFGSSVIKIKYFLFLVFLIMHSVQLSEITSSQFLICFFRDWSFTTLIKNSLRELRTLAKQSRLNHSISFQELVLYFFFPSTRPFK